MIAIEGTGSSVTCPGCGRTHLLTNLGRGGTVTCRGCGVAFGWSRLRRRVRRGPTPRSRMLMDLAVGERRPDRKGLRRSVILLILLLGAGVAVFVVCRHADAMGKAARSLVSSSSERAP